MSNGLQRLGQAARKIFTGRKKINISDVNKSTVKDTATNNSSISRGYKPTVETPGATGRHAYGSNSPIVKSIRCGRNWLG